MKKRILFYIGLIYVGLTVSSCSDFLQKDPPSSPSESIFWQKKSDFDYALTACYSSIIDNGFTSDMGPCFDNLTDNALCQFDDGWYGKTKTMIMGDIYSTTDGFVSGVFNGSFKAISRCNLFMDKLNAYEGTDISDTDRTYMIAQVKALRAYFYHWLFFCYKEVPVFTNFLSLEEQYQPKASRKEIYDQIMKDFSEAAAALNDATYMDAPGRFTKGACYAYMARVEMFNAYSDDNGIPTGIAKPEAMKKVIEYCENVKGYALDKSLRTAFIESQQMSSTEMIFSARYAAPDLTNSANVAYCAWSCTMIQRNLVDAYECTDGKAWGESPLTVPVNEDLLTSPAADKAAVRAEREKLFINRDARMSASIIPSTVYRFPELPGYPDNAVIYDSEPGFTGFGVFRFIQPFTADEKPYNSIVGADFNLMRYAHVLLMLAEAENEANGPTAKAYDAINQVRVRAGQPELPQGLTKEQLRDRIRKEWRIETVLEGWRYFQLKQWNELKNVPAIVAQEKLYTVAAKYEDRFMFWPIPQAEIDKANGLLVQDPAYK